MDHAELQELYDDEEYYWGTEPNDLAETAVNYLDTPEDATAVDIGAGEGRDAVYLAEQGLAVFAIDPIPAGLKKTERLADERGVSESVETIRGDVNEIELPEQVELLYSIGTIQYLRPENRDAQFEQFKRETSSGGVHALFAFVDHPEIPTAPDWGDNEYCYEQGELREYYENWDLLEEEELVFDDESGGEPHQHAAEVVVARKA
ncbi:methyltransferase domain-containing protein [Halorussus halophilus]|uniref:methyltransferase domain-containing protein n=1 Tax=Halorussus halophilus TaxID=2650975 RepID=UPI0013017A80|nr:methyltransferase domain-containing protein [Halorussus halophilus]